MSLTRRPLVGRTWNVGRAARVVFAASVAAELALVFGLRYFVTVDGAFHVSVAALLRDIAQGHGHEAFRYYRWHIFPLPNLISDLVLTGLMFLFDPALSEKLLIAGYLVGLPLATLYAVRAVRPESSWLAFLALPLSFSFSFNYGFYDFSYSLILFLVTAGYALRHSRQLNARRAATLSVLLLLTYFTHIVGFLESILFVGSLIAVQSVIDRRDLRPGIARRLVLSALALAPSCALALVFFASTTTAEPNGWAFQPLVRAEVFDLGLGITSYSQYEAAWSLLVASALAVMVIATLLVRGRPRLALRVTDGPLLFVVVAVVAVLVAPFQVASGGSFIVQRLALFPVYGVALWVASSPVPRRTLISTAVVALIAATGLAVMRLPFDRKLDTIVSDYMSVEPCLAPHSSIVQVNMALALPGSHVRLDPVTSEAGRLAADLHGVDLGSVEGSVPFYLLQYRSRNDPMTQLVPPGNDIESIPPQLDPLGFARRPGGGVDYVVVFGLTRASADVLRAPTWKSLHRQLLTGYRLVSVSPRRWLEVWERDGSPAARSGSARRSASRSPVCIRPSADGPAAKQ